MQSTIKVYFETKGYAEHVATFYSEEMYMSCLQSLYLMCNKLGFDNVTESIEYQTI
jgi:hypothetical protein